MATFDLNILDQSPVFAGQTPANALADTIELAQFAERAGYKRYWVAEHHNTASFADAAPEILLGYMAAKTTHIHIGSGGIMLPHYSPYKVAEQFRMLATLAPGRIDLGIGRAPGGDTRTAAALQAGPQKWPLEVFPQQIELLQQFLQDAENDTIQEKWGFEDTHPYRGIRAQPVNVEAAHSPAIASPLMWVLGSGGDGAVHAATFGLPYVYAHFINQEAAEHAIETYKRLFRPSAYLQKPKIAFAISLLVAETSEKAEQLSAARNLWAVRLMQNKAGFFPTQADALAHNFTPEEAALLAQIEQRSLSGTPETVYQHLLELHNTYDSEEFFIVTITPDPHARQQSYGLLAEYHKAHA